MQGGFSGLRHKHLGCSWAGFDFFFFNFSASANYWWYTEVSNGPLDVFMTYSFEEKKEKNEDLPATVEEIFWHSLSSLFLGRRWQISFLDVSDFLPAWTFLPLTAKALAWHFRCLPSVNCPQNFLFTLSAQNCRKLNFAVPSKYKSKSKWGRVKKDDSVLILLESLVKTVKLSQALEWSELMPVVKLVKGPNPIDTNTVYQMIVAQIGN